MILNKLKYYLLLILLVAFLAACDKVTDPKPIIEPEDIADYELVWSDEFEQQSGELDQNFWNYELGYGDNGWGNDEWQQYTDEPENVRVENGNMIITALCPSGEPGKRDGSVTSGRVTTQNKFSFKFGKIQARIKPPSSNGMWPAFWMLGASYDSVGWPQCGEIDIMEMSPLLWGENSTSCTVHWWDEDEESLMSYGQRKDFNNLLTDDFHIFDLEWDEQRIVGKIDEITYFVKIINTDTMTEFLNEYFILLNVAVGGNLGGAPDASTIWPQEMLIDWIRVYQKEGTDEVVETFGIFTDETPVDASITVGQDADIYVWENTLSGVAYTPYEGSNVISFLTTGMGWFGGGIASNLPLDLSGFAEGYLNFMIKIPENVTFKIGISDVDGHENYVEFPANETVYGLVRNGEWGQASIPISDIQGNVNLALLNYEFMILEENGIQCHVVIDDIYWSGGGVLASNVSFDNETYNEDATNAQITVIDEAVENQMVSVSVDNGSDTIHLDINLDANGEGSVTLNFGATDDETDTIIISEGMILTVTYMDSSENIKTDTANVIGNPMESTAFGVFTDLTPVFDALVIGENADIWVWDNTLIIGTLPPYEGENVLSWQTAGIGWFGAGIQSMTSMDFSEFGNGSIKFMIKIPADVTFKIGINDTQSNENYVTFPANQPAFGLERNGDWEQAVIPVSAIQGSVNLQMLNYEFIVLEENGSQCDFAIDDIYWDSVSIVESSIAFDADIYYENDSSATVSVHDEEAADNLVNVMVDNGVDTINIDINLDSNGSGTALLNFGLTDDESDTIAISEGDVLTATYNDMSGNIRTDTADILANVTEGDVYGIYTDLTPVYDGLVIGETADIWVWENTLTTGTITPYEGENVISWQTAGIGWFGAGIQSTIAMDFSSFAAGSIKFMIKIPSDVTFKIGINDTQANESYVQFPANQTAFGLERNGEWGQAVIPFSNIQGSVNLQMLNYEFIILEENGAQCEFAIDDIYYDPETVDPPPVETAGIYSESHTDVMIPYQTIINSADWSGNGASPDEQSTEVTSLDGSYVLAVDLTDFGAGWGGISFDFGNPGQDITTYNTLVLSINRSEMTTLSKLGVKLEDNSAGNFEVNIESYAPQINGQWATYEIPLNVFIGVNLSDLKYLGLWNPSDNSSNLLFGNLYFDNIYLTDN